MFGDYVYPQTAYRAYVGLDDTALFGSSVAVSDQFTVAGSNGYNIFEGIVHVYIPTACHWSLQSYIRSPAGDNGNFGVSVAISVQYTGKAFIFRFINEKYWMHEATLNSPLGFQHGFGFSVSIDGNYTVVGTGLNEAFVYELTDHNGWTLNSQLVSGLQVGNNFGRSVSVSGDKIVVGADGVGGSIGAAYVYKLNRTDPTHPWKHTDTLESVYGYSSYFGHSVDISGDTLVVGARGYEALVFNPRGNQTDNNPGWAHIYDFNHTSNAWSLSQTLVSPAGQNSYFGESVAIHDDVMIVGADGFPLGDLTGSAFTFIRNRSDTTVANWVFDTALGSAAGAEGHFGFAVDICTTNQAIGAFGHNNLQGGAFLACRDPLPTRSPVPLPYVPSEQPTSMPTKDAKKFSGGSGSLGIQSKFPWGVIVAIILGGVTLLTAIAAAIYFRLCCAAPVAALLKKKDKEEEGNSPYTVYGAGGLLDDDGDSVYGPSFYRDGSNGASSFYSGSDAGSGSDYSQQMITILSSVSETDELEGEDVDAPVHSIYSPRDTPESQSLVEQARARMAAIRHTVPLKIVTAAGSNSQEDIISPLVSPFLSPTHSRIHSRNHSLVDEARSHLVAIKKIASDSQSFEITPTATPFPQQRSPVNYLNIMQQSSNSQQQAQQGQAQTESVAVTSSLVSEARARGNVIRAVSSEASVNSVDSVGGAHSASHQSMQSNTDSSAQSDSTVSSEGSGAVEQAKASYAQYKLRILRPEPTWQPSERNNKS
eukprot:gene26405-32983_t